MMPTPQHDTAGQDAGAHAHHWPDINLRELGTLAPLLALTIVFGVWPGPIFQLVAPALAHVLQPFDGGAAAAMFGR